MERKWLRIISMRRFCDDGDDINKEQRRMSGDEKEE
jgi:hypothetical protein